MNYRINVKALTFVGVLVLIAIGLFVYTLVQAPNDPQPLPTAETEAEVGMVSDTLITAKHQYKEGVHTIVGSVEVDNPCFRIVAEPFLLEDGTVAEVRLSSLMVGEECVGEPTSVPFSVTFEADEGVTIQAVWNGSPARLNLVPVGPDEVLDDQVYFKG